MVAVGRDARGRVWLGDPRPGTRLTDYEPGVQGLAGEVTLAGGLLPPEAVAAVVRDRVGKLHEATCANGAWVALLPEPVRGERPLVRFRDEAGELVTVPLPPGVRLEPVSDAREPCPVCEARNWARVVAAPCGRYGEDGAGRLTAAVCRRCGHEEALGVLYAPLAAEVSDPAAVGTGRVTRDMNAAARSVRFPVYGLVEHEPEVVGYGSHGQEVDRVTLAFGTAADRITIETSAEDPWESPDGLARRALEGLLGERDTEWPERSQTAVLLWLNGRHRTHAGDAAAEPATERAVSIDGEPASFTTVSHDNRFAAVGDVNDLRITIAGHGDPPDLALTALDPSTL
jgi:hypothetical protein